MSVDVEECVGAHQRLAERCERASVGILRDIESARPCCFGCFCGWLCERL